MKEQTPQPTVWKDNPFKPEWAERDYLYSPVDPKECPNHPCKLTYLVSKPFIRSFRTALDIGCRVGEFSRYLQQDFQRVYAFDPNVWIKFRWNVDLKIVTHYECALGDEPGETLMYGGSHAAQYGGRPKVVRVNTLDAFNFQEVDYIKVDVEGFEKKVLVGGAETIERCNPVIVLEQNHVVLEGDQRHSAKQYLESIGYKQVAVDERGWDFVMRRD